MRYLVVIERTDGNYSAYSPDLPGCIATGKNPRQARQNMEEAILFHLQGLMEDGLPIPESKALANYIFVPKKSLSDLSGR